MSDTNKAAEIAAIMAEFRISEKEAEISWERRKVYGDPWINHLGIAQAWTGILQPWALRIARMDPIPPHVVALMMVGLKTNRCRMTFHDDNYDDASVYASFARTWQKRWVEEGGEGPVVIMPPPSKMHKLTIAWQKPDAKMPDQSGRVVDSQRQSRHFAHNNLAFEVVWSASWDIPELLLIGRKKYKLVEVKE